jgi:hypothetical protein
MKKRMSAALAVGVCAITMGAAFPGVTNAEETTKKGPYPSAERCNQEAASLTKQGYIAYCSRNGDDYWVHHD